MPRIDPVAGGMPGAETSQIKYRIGLYEEGILKKIFRTQVDFALPIIKSEARKSKSRLEKEFPDKYYEIKELS